MMKFVDADSHSHHAPRQPQMGVASDRAFQETVDMQGGGSALWFQEQGADMTAGEDEWVGRSRMPEANESGRA